jgi:hypothetical protein
VDGATGQVREALLRAFGGHHEAQALDIEPKRDVEIGDAEFRDDRRCVPHAPA